MASTTAEILTRLAETFDDRARDRDEDAVAHAAAGLDALYAYDNGLATAYRGAARKVRFEIAQLEA